MTPCAAVAAVLLLVLAARPGFAQSPWSIEVGTERSFVTIDGVAVDWATTRVQAGVARPEVGGWYGAVERQQRGPLSDVALAAHGYRRLGPWTIAGGAAGSVDPAFLYRTSADGEISRRIVRTLYASGAYRYLNFKTATVHQMQPALTWYHPRGEIGGRLYVTHKGNQAPSSVTVTASTLFDISSRVRVGAFAAYGDRIFDVAALPTVHATAYMVNARVRFRVSSHDFIEVGAGEAGESPSFGQHALSLVYRRGF